MRLLIANHIDASLLRQADQRTFTQRIFWLAREGDVVLLSAPPDEDFLTHVAGLTGIDKGRLKIIVLPEGRDGCLLFDPLVLISEDFVARLRPLVRDCSEILCLWPSVQVAELAYMLGLENVFAGAPFFKQGGDALANSKATFRAVAAGAGTPIPEGLVCRTIEEFQASTQAQVASGRALMVKQSHNGAGAGNCIIVPFGTGPGTAGASHTRHFASVADVDRISQELWAWASAQDRFPVVLEEFKSGYRTIYFEYIAEEGGVRFAAAGALEYDDGKLLREHTPLMWDIPERVLRQGIADGLKLAERYHAMGYRGYMSADAILGDDGDLLFTEMNARIGGSPHVYDGIWRRVVQRAPEVDRYIVQYLTPVYWRALSTIEVIEGLARVGAAYDARTRTGAMLGIPPHAEIGGSSYLLCLVTETAQEQPDLYALLDEEFCVG